MKWIGLNLQQTHRMLWDDWIGKRIFVRLKSGKFYSGEVIEVDDGDGGPCFIKILDKFHSPVVFAATEILEIKLDDRPRSGDGGSNE